MVDETCHIFLVPTVYGLSLRDLEEVAIPAINPGLFVERGTDIFDNAGSLGNRIERKQTAPRTGTLNRKAVIAGSEPRRRHKFNLLRAICDLERLVCTENLIRICLAEGIT